MLTGEYPFFGRDKPELKQNVKMGVYKIPRDVSVSFECIDFLNCCLKFESNKRKSWDDLIHHPFLSDAGVLSRHKTRLDKAEAAFTKTL